MKESDIKRNEDLRKSLTAPHVTELPGVKKERRPNKVVEKLKELGNKLLDNIYGDETGVPM